MADFAVQAKQLEMRQAAAERELARIAATKQQLGNEKVRDRRQGRRGQGAALDAQGPGRRRRAAPTSAPAPPPLPDQRRRAPAAPAPPCSYAMAQVGDAYVYGAAGPSAFDCSGLTMMAWAQAGVSLPHSSSAQMGSGPALAVPAAARRPGVLLQPGQPRGHVHRQRHDRARGQPRQRRHHRPGELDAVLRCRPTRLTDASRPVAHVCGWPACLSSWSSPSGSSPSSSWCEVPRTPCSRDGRPAHPAPATPPRPATTRLTAAATPQRHCWGG